MQDSMATPTGIRNKPIAINDTDRIHIYSDASRIWLQLRRNHPTEDDIGTPSFKTAFLLSPEQALAIAAELLIVVNEKLTDHLVAKPAGAKVGPAKSALVKTPLPSEKEWTAEEDKRLLSRLNSKLSLEEIAKKHKRGVESVRARLAALAKR